MALYIWHSCCLYFYVNKFLGDFRSDIFCWIWLGGDDTQPSVIFLWHQFDKLVSKTIKSESWFLRSLKLRETREILCCERFA